MPLQYANISVFAKKTEVKAIFKIRYVTNAATKSEKLYSKNGTIRRRVYVAPFKNIRIQTKK